MKKDNMPDVCVICDNTGFVSDTEAECCRCGEGMPDTLYCRVLNSGVHFSCVRQESPLVKENIDKSLKYTHYTKTSTIQPTFEDLKVIKKDDRELIVLGAFTTVTVEDFISMLNRRDNS